MRKFCIGTKFPNVELCLIFLGIVLWSEMELLVPSLPSMKDYFEVSKGQIQQVLSANFFGFFIGVLLAGPICDSLGRRKTSVVGMLLFLLCSTWVCLAESMGSMLMARFFQGLFVTGPMIGGMTMLLERTYGVRQVFWMSLSSASITLAMAASPLIGSTINEFWGFRGNLWAVVVFGTLGFLPFLFFASETLAKEKMATFAPKTIIKNYLAIVKNREFMRLAIAVSALPAAYWIYAGVSSLYFVNHLGVEEKAFGLYQAPICATFAVLSLSISLIYRKLGETIPLKIGFWMMLIGSFGLLLMPLIDQEHPRVVTMLMMLFVGGMTPANSLLFPEALNKLPMELQGSGQAMIQALRLLFATVGTGMLGVFYQGTFMPVAIILLFLFLLSSFLIHQGRTTMSKLTTSKTQAHSGH